jgi:hypothetical protein
MAMAWLLGDQGRRWRGDRRRWGGEGVVMVICGGDNVKSIFWERWPFEAGGDVGMSGVGRRRRWCSVGDQNGDGVVEHSVPCRLSDVCGGGRLR